MIFNLTSGGFTAHLSDESVILNADSTTLTFPAVNHVPDLMIIMTDVAVGSSTSTQDYVVAGLLSTYDNVNTMNFAKSSQFGGSSGTLSASLVNGELTISVSGGAKFRGHTTGSGYTYHLYYTDIG